MGKRQGAASGNVALRHSGEKGRREIFETAVTIPGLREPGICEETTLQRREVSPSF